jgi:chromosome partitioning protein
MANIENFEDFQEAVATAMENQGWQIIFPEEKMQGYDFEAVKGDLCAAVQIKNWKRTVGVPQIRQFIDFFKLPMGSRFNRGFFVTTSDFGKAAMTLAEQKSEKPIFLGIFQKGQLRVLKQSNQPDLYTTASKDGKTYIGVFTAKGGVGKTTISAHLAGALALMGYDVALIDLDPQQHLNQLLPEGIYIPKQPPHLGGTINVFHYEEYDTSFKERFVICDCSPELNNNPPEIVEKFNYCLVPTTLNPLGINKNGHVITSTFENLRNLNSEAYLFVLINNFLPAQKSQIIRILKREYQKIFRELETEDERFRFIPPEECAIRYSQQLFYWGSHLYMDIETELAFQTNGGRCLPKEDFLRLVEYLEETTQIRQLKLL